MVFIASEAVNNLNSMTKDNEIDELQIISSLKKDLVALSFVIRFKVSTFIPNPVFTVSPLPHAVWTKSLPY